MAKPYSQDLRDRVIDAVKRGKMSRRAAAQRYKISESVAIKWLERVERDGSPEPVGHGSHRGIRKQDRAVAWGDAHAECSAREEASRAWCRGSPRRCDRCRPF